MPDMKELLSQERSDTWRSFLQTFATVTRKLEAQMKVEDDIPLAWYGVLVHLNDAPQGRLLMNELAQTMFLIPSNLTRLLDRLQHAGFVRREPCPDDRRAIYAVITEEGKAALKAAVPGHNRRVHEHFMQYLTDEDVQALGLFLSHMPQGSESTLVEMAPRLQVFS